MKNTEQPAFPVHGGLGDDPRNQILGGGITKREYFAAMFMQPMIAGEGARMVADRDLRYDETNWKEIVAKNAIEFADELLKQLEQ